MVKTVSLSCVVQQIHSISFLNDWHGKDIFNLLILGLEAASNNAGECTNMWIIPELWFRLFACHLTMETPHSVLQELCSLLPIQGYIPWGCSQAWIYIYTSWGPSRPLIHNRDAVDGKSVEVKGLLFVRSCCSWDPIRSSRSCKYKRKRCL
jgi:hypothetical protein